MIISYRTLDTRHDKIRTHHFVILNHFRDGIKIFIPFYLFFSTNKNIMGFKKKVYANPAFHEGLLLLIYEHFKAQTHRRALAHKVEPSKDTKSSYLSFDIEDNA